MLAPCQCKTESGGYNVLLERYSAVLESWIVNSGSGTLCSPLPVVPLSVLTRRISYVMYPLL